jgi:endonuclease-3 related protein
VNTKLHLLYQTLLAHFGPQHWWPADSPFEVMVGAVLTQNTHWKNVEKAITALDAEGLLEPSALAQCSPAQLAALIRPAGYYNLKAQRLHNLLALITEQGGVEALLQQPLPGLRELLLAVKGIGPETADSIVLYAAQQPIFVVDAYTHRILFRHGLIPEDAQYVAIQESIMAQLEEDVALFKEYHALLVCLGKNFCKKSKPRCQGCPLEGFGLD